MKKTLVALIGAASMFAAMSASAAPYFLVRGGLTDLETEHKTHEQDDKELDVMKYNNALFDFGVGMNLTRNLRVELTLGARAGDTAEEEWSIPTILNIKQENEITTSLIMLSAYYDFHFGSRFVPFIGGSIGHAKTEIEHKLTLNGVVDQDIKFDDTDMAYRVIGGFSYFSGRNSAWELSYAYANYGEVEYLGEKFETTGSEFAIGYRHSF